MLGRFGIAVSVAACLVLAATKSSGPVPARAWNAITPQALLKHIRVLASDDFEGRAPATSGEQKTVDYLVSACRAMKLSPGNPDGTYPPVPPGPIARRTCRTRTPGISGNQRCRPRVEDSVGRDYRMVLLLGPPRTQNCR